MGLKGFVLASALLLSAGAAQAQAPAFDPAMGGSGDAAHGLVVFKAHCAICHQPDKGGKNGIGPALYGAFGRTAGKAPGFPYSDNMKAASFVWTPEKINQWIQKPVSLVAGAKMVLAPVSAVQDRADIIAFLKTKSDAKDSPGGKSPHEKHEEREHKGKHAKHAASPL